MSIPCTLYEITVLFLGLCASGIALHWDYQMYRMANDKTVHDSEIMLFATLPFTLFINFISFGLVYCVLAGKVHSG